MKKIVVSFVVLITLLTLAGCNNIFQPSSSAGPSGAETEKGYVRLQFSSAAGRTILPSTYVFAAYELTFSPVSAGEGDSRTPQTFTADEEAYELEVGEWTLAVAVYSDPEKQHEAATASGIQVIVVHEENPTTVRVPLVFSSMTGTGTLSYDITKPSNFTLKEGSITLEKYGDGEDVEPISLLSGLSDSKTDIPAGYYWLTVTLQDGGSASDGQKAVWSDVVHIYPNQTTNVEHTFTSNDFFRNIDNLWIVGIDGTFGVTVEGVNRPNTILMIAEDDGTFTWEGELTTNRTFRFSLTNTSTWPATGLGGEFSNPWRGDWLAAPVANTSVSNIDTYSMKLVTGYNLTDDNWSIATGYYKINVNPYDLTNGLAVAKPTKVTGVTITPNNGTEGEEAVNVYIYGQRSFSATVQGHNSPSQDVTWSVVTSGLEEGIAGGTSITGTGGLLAVGGKSAITGSEASQSLTVRATSTADDTKYADVTVTAVFPEIDTIVINGVNVVEKGEQQNYSATVTFGDDSNIPEGVSRAVTWSVARENDDPLTGAAIDPTTGVLSIGENEDIGTLIITATSVYDTRESGTKEVEVVVVEDPEVISVVVSPSTATVLRGGTRQFSVAVTAVGGATDTVTWSISSNKTSTNTTINQNGELAVGADESPGGITLTITATSEFVPDEADDSYVPEYGTATVMVPAQVAVPAPTDAALSPAGVATWTAPNDETNISGYSVHLYRGGGSTPIETFSVNKGVSSKDLVNEMRTDAEGFVGDGGSFPVTYTVGVIAIPADSNNYLVSEASTSTVQAVSKSPSVGGTLWYYDLAQWYNTDTVGDFIIELYRNDSLVKEISVTRSTSVSTANLAINEYNTAPDKAEYGGVGLYTFRVKAKGDDALVYPSDWSAVSSGENGVTAYSPFGNSTVNTIVAGGTTVVNEVSVTRYVAGGDGGKIAWSDGGTIWTLPTVNPFTSSEAVRGIAYGNGLFVAVGDNGKIATSSDGGTSWETRTSAISKRLLSVAYGNNKFVVGADGGHPNVMYSSNGTDWAVGSYYGNSNNAILDQQSATSIIYAEWTVEPTDENDNGIRWRFIAGGDKGVINSSLDGIDWTWVENLTDVNNPNRNGVISMAFGEGRVVVIIANDSYIPYATLSEGGLAWGENWLNSNMTKPLVVAYGSGAFYAAGEEGQISKLLDTSTVWAAMTVGEGTDQTQFKTREGITAVGYGAGKFILHGNRYAEWYGDTTNPNMGKMAVITLP